MGDKSKDKAKRKQGPKKIGGVQKQLFIIVGLVMAVLFLPVTVMLVLGMLPTPMAALTETSSRKFTKMICVGAMNFAGCTPFLLELIASEASFEQAMIIISNPTAIIVMYSAAGLGYLIDWSMTGIVAGIMYEKGRKRQETILQVQEDLVKRWGPEVTGEKELDEYGFSVEAE